MTISFCFLKIDLQCCVTGTFFSDLWTWGLHVHFAPGPNYVACLALQTHLTPRCGRRLHRWVEFGQVPGDLGHKPLETLAVKGAAELFLCSYISSGEVAVLGPALVDVLRVLVHPHLCHSLQVLEGIGRCKCQALRRAEEKSGYKGSWRWRSTFLILCCIKDHSPTVFLSLLYLLFMHVSRTLQLTVE